MFVFLNLKHSDNVSLAACMGIGTVNLVLKISMSNLYMQIFVILKLVHVLFF